jgi:hypothetical protein
MLEVLEILKEPKEGQPELAEAIAEKKTITLPSGGTSKLAINKQNNTVVRDLTMVLLKDV